LVWERCQNGHGTENSLNQSTFIKGLLSALPGIGCAEGRKDGLDRMLVKHQCIKDKQKMRICRSDSVGEAREVGVNLGAKTGKHCEGQRHDLVTCLFQSSLLPFLTSDQLTTWVFSNRTHGFLALTL
jgi:hypothetical protein